MARPFVYVNMATTADGKITSADREYPRFTSPKDRVHMDRLRAEADAILLGAGTVRADNPTWHVRSESMRDYRRSLGKEGAPIRVLVSASASVDASCRFFEDLGDGARRILVTVEDAPPDAISAIESRVEVWRIGRGCVDLPALLERLAAERVERLLVEGGGELNWALVKEDLVDELHLTIAPALLGGRQAPTLLDGEGLPMQKRRKLRLEEARREGDELFCRWTVLR